MTPDFPKQLRPGPLEAIGLWKARAYLLRVKEALVADLVNQPTNRPTNKVLASGAGVSAGLILWAARKLGYELAPADVEIILAAVGVIVSYFVVRDRANTGPRSQP